MRTKKPIKKLSSMINTNELNLQGTLNQMGQTTQAIPKSSIQNVSGVTDFEIKSEVRQKLSVKPPLNPRGGKVVILPTGVID